LTLRVKTIQISMATWCFFVDCAKRYSPRKSSAAGSAFGYRMPRICDTLWLFETATADPSISQGG
jgi:hypothetical protein